MKAIGITALVLAFGVVALTACASASLSLDGTLWRMTAYRNAGGAMVEVAYDIGKSSYMLVQLHIEEEDIPEFLMGQSMWTNDERSTEGTKKSGIKFLTDDELAALKEEDMEIDIPPEAMGLDVKKQKALDKLLGDILDSADD